MKNYKLALGAIILALVTPIMAAETASSCDSVPAKGNHAAVDAALKACSVQAGADASGRPNREAFDACMKAKGFEKPAGGPPGGKGGHPPPPPQ